MKNRSLFSREYHSIWQNAINKCNIGRSNDWGPDDDEMTNLNFFYDISTMKFSLK
jgi:hypothetical protein